MVGALRAVSRIMEGAPLVAAVVSISWSIMHVARSWGDYCLPTLIVIGSEAMVLWMPCFAWTRVWSRMWLRALWDYTLYIDCIMGYAMDNIYIKRCLELFNALSKRADAEKSALRRGIPPHPPWSKCLCFLLELRWQVGLQGDDSARLSWVQLCSCCRL